MIINNVCIQPEYIFDNQKTMYRIDHKKLVIVPFEIMGRHEKQLYHVRLGELVPCTPEFKYFTCEREASAELLCLVEDAISDASELMDKARERFTDLCDLERALGEKCA